MAADLMETAKDVTRTSEVPWRDLLRYTVLRLPTFLSTLMPVAALIAGLLTVGALHRHMELVAILNTGISPTGLLRCVLLAGLPLVAMQFALDDRVVPRTVKELYAWGVGVYEMGRLQQDSGEWLWLYSGDDVVRMKNPRPGSNSFAGLTIFQRSEDGLLLKRIDAPRAHRVANGLVLQDVVTQDAANGTVETLPEFHWQGRIDFQMVEILSWEPRDLSLSQLSQVIEKAGYGQRPIDIYRTWYHGRLAAALQPLLMLLLSMSLIPSYSRTRSFGWVFFVGISIGFGAFILTGVSTAMGEAGLLPPWFAAWAPVVALSALIGRFLLEHEILQSAGRRGRRAA
jgi:lipopolysaccharide export system permease protein